MFDIDHERFARGWAVFALCAACAGCTFRPAEERWDLDQQVGLAELRELSFEVQEGLAAVQEANSGTVVFWAQAPALQIRVRSTSASEQTWRLRFRNIMPAAELSWSSSTGLPQPSIEAEPSATSKTWRVRIPAGTDAVLQCAPPDDASLQTWRFGVLSDVQDDLGRFDDIIARMNADPALRFIVSTGDLTEDGAREELERFQEALELLSVPLFTTIGNHELGASPRHWNELFGRTSFTFAFKGVRFYMVDSGSATIDPSVYDALSQWMRQNAQPHQAFVSHVPTIDPVGLRGGSFASRKEAALLHTLLAKHGVDVMFHGHLHSYFVGSSAGIPTYVSGGGGAIPEEFDGIDRHYLAVDIDPLELTHQVALVRVD